MVAKKWDMAAAVASHLIKVDPGTAGWWISLAYALRRTECVEKAEAILLRAQTIHPEVGMIAFNLACYASVAGRMEEAKERLRHAIELDKEARKLALEDEDLRPLWDWIAGRSSHSGDEALHDRLTNPHSGAICDQSSGIVFVPKFHTK